MANIANMTNTAISLNNITGSLQANHYLIPKNKPTDRTLINNPLYTASGIRKPRPADPITNIDHINQIYNALLNLSRQRKACLRSATLFAFGIQTGLRFQSLASIKVRDVVNMDGSIKSSFLVYESKTRKTNERFLTPEIQSLLSNYLSTMPTLGKKKKYFSLNDYLFPSITDFSEPYSRHSFTSVLKQVGTQLNLTYNIATHTMRKTFAYWIIKNNPSDLDTMNCLMKLFNHSSLQVTLSYAGVTKEKTNSITQQLSTTLSNAFTSEEEYSTLKATNTANTTNIPSESNNLSSSKIERIMSILCEDDDEDDED